MSVTALSSSLEERLSRSWITDGRPAMLHDIAVHNSFGLRLPVLGPVVNTHLVGLDFTLAILDCVLPHLNAPGTPLSTLCAKVGRGELGFKTGGRFLPWTEESTAAARNRLATCLLDVLAVAKWRNRAPSNGTGRYCGRTALS